MKVSQKRIYKIISSASLVNYISVEENFTPFLSKGLSLSSPYNSLQFLYVASLSKIFLTIGDYIVVDKHHINYFQAFNSYDTSFEFCDNNFSVIISTEFKSLANDSHCIVPLIDGSDFWLTSAFGHVIRVIDPLTHLLNNLPISRLNFADLVFSSLLYSNDNIFKPPIDNEKITIVQPWNQLNLDHNCVFEIRDVSILFWNKITASQGVRSLCESFYAEQENPSVVATLTSWQYSFKIPILTRKKQRYPRWINCSELIDSNCSLYYELIPEDHNPSDLANFLSVCPIIIAAPGSAAYIPLTINNSSSIVVMPIAGPPDKNMDEYVYDFLCFQPKIFFHYKLTAPWNWNDEFSVSPSEFNIYLQNLIKFQKTLSHHA